MKRNIIRDGVQQSLEKEKYLDENGNMLRYSRPKRMDGGLIIVVFLLMCFGFVMLFSASMTEGFFSQDKNPMYFIARHVSFTGVGVVFALIIAIFVPIRVFDRIGLVILTYVGTLAMLASIFIRFNNPIIKGVVLNGARRWVNILGFQFQPSEFAKIALVFCFAGYMSWVRRTRASGGFNKKRRSYIGQLFFDGFIDMALPAMCIGLWCLLVILQPHVSWLVIISVMTFFLFINARIPWKSWVFGIIILMVVMLVLGLVFVAALPLMPDSIKESVSFEYVAKRIAIQQNPDSLNKDDIFQTTQSIHAIGSGGVKGVGFGNSIQKWGYLPMQYNDYVFSIIAEEIGLIGSIAVILLFILFLILGIKIAYKTSSIFAYLIAFGFTVIVPLQAFLNIGVATGLLPPTGISLPFFSYGGTSTVFFTVGIGLLLCVSKSGVKYKKQPGQDVVKTS